MRDLKYYHELEDMCEEQLNDCYETVKICGYDYDQGHALRQLDPIAFRQIALDMIDEDYEEVRISDMTEEEREGYYASDSSEMYCFKEV